LTPFATNAVLYPFDFVMSIPIAGRPLYSAADLGSGDPVDALEQSPQQRRRLDAKHAGFLSCREPCKSVGLYAHSGQQRSQHAVGFGGIWWR